MPEFDCYIVDDEADSIEILQDYIDQTPSLQLVYSTTEPRNIFNEITQPGKPKITFLDIEMPGLSGLEVAGLINTHTAIIFVTSHTEHALEAFEKDAYDYLVKPFNYSRFLKAVIKVKGRIRSKPVDDGYFFIHGNIQSELIKIYFHEIIYIESLQNYVRLHTVNGSPITYLTLKEMELKLSPTNFLKVHKSHIVNLEQISGFMGNELNMVNGKKVRVGRVFRPELLLRLQYKTISSRRRKIDG